jgi:Gpi18-like mannosyltransferase
VINASFYGQMDAMWAAPALGGVYYLLRDKPWHGIALCGVALAVKPQGIFVFPVLLLLALAGRLPWRTLLAAPAAMAALALPAVVFGRDPIDLLTIYDLERQAQHVPALSLRAPSLYAFVTTAGSRADTVRLLGIALTAAIVLGICWVLVARAVELDRTRVVTAATLFALLLPFLLPGMHERYFFLADVMTLILAVYRPRLWYVPLLVQAASLLAYRPYLFERSESMTLPAAMMLAAVLVVGHALLVDPQRGQRLLQLVRLDQHVPGLAALGRPHDAAGLHEVHEPARLGEADPQLALEHRGRTELARDDQLDRLDQ